MWRLYCSEFKRLWGRKLTLLCAVAIPFIVALSSKYYLENNLAFDVTSPQYTSISNFPVAAIQEQLIFSFNLIAIFLTVLCVTQEFKGGYMRMVLVRPIKRSHVFWAKYLVVLSSIFMLLVEYYVFSSIIGRIVFQRVDNVAVFYMDKLLDNPQMFIYSIKYYLYSFLTLSIITGVIFLISTIGSNMVISTGVNLGFVLTSLVYPTVISVFLRSGNFNINKLRLLSITEIQHKGLAAGLGMHSYLNSFMLLVLGVYGVLGIVLSYLIYKRKDQLI
ncbi:ABC transporter permease subunit [Oceanirhabdus seepicola]|uniref:ABC transporter permease n=1 Tax=Oceanirhabdus seepicola TaxID=2828781 RepID=A0A9J6P633_9CLOT|nr:ABC transporter permease subunit [Oceanirhabdus seepicola]MCM1991590.1 ABC transporter permease [Oceanirhabdus seepicola]